MILCLTDGTQCEWLPVNILLGNQKTVHKVHTGTESAGQGGLMHANRNGGL